MKEIQAITLRFAPEALEISVTYTHPHDEAPTSSTRPRVARAMAMKALEEALRSLKAEGARVEWGGYATDYVTTTDKVLVERSLG